MIKSLKIACFLFVCCSFVLSCFAIMESVKIYEYKNSVKNEQLSSVSQLMTELAGYIEENDTRAVDNTSDLILRCGYVNSFSDGNKVLIYDFLSYIRSGREIDSARCSAYARACSYCALKELSGEGYLLDRYESEREADIQPMSKPKYKYGYDNKRANVIDYSDIRCAYNGNKYTIIQNENEIINEYVSLVSFNNDTFILSDKLLLDTESIVVDTGEFIFSDLDIDFYIVGAEEYDCFVGIDKSGNIRYYKLL